MTVKHNDQNPQIIELERFLPYRLNVAAEAVSRALSRIYAQRFGITVPEWRVVAALGQYGQMTAKDIGNHSRMHKTKVSRAVASLISGNLVVKQPNRMDLRETHLELSSKGNDIYKAIVPGALAFEDKLFEGLSAGDRQQLESLLATLVDHAEKIEKQELDEGQE